jgi:serine protease
MRRLVHGILSLGLVLAGATPAAAAAAAAEWNPVRTAPVDIGPRTSRILIGFRATPLNAVVHRVKSRRSPAAIRVVQAQTTDADARALALRVGLLVSGSRQITPSMHVLFLPNTLFGAAVGAALNRLRADPAVLFADADERRHAHMVTPDDPLFPPIAGAGGQWYLLTPPAAATASDDDLAATDAVSAWGITTGSDGIVIADVDTGVRFEHPDLLRAGFAGRLLPGYDFVGEDYNPSTGAPLGTYLIANDGDGWDPDPSDPGDWLSATDERNALFPAASCGPPAPSSWHGTRVVGVYGALTNNGVGVAGMTWGSWILPVRALGKCGGYDSDIITAIEWAAGLPVSGVPDNPYPADIVNLSLGGTSASGCPADYQTALTTVTGMGVVVVASVGNGGDPGALAPVEAPADCSLLVPGVIAVAGLRNVGTKVGFSSFGAEASIAAPAGNCVNTTGPCLRPIDTTTNFGSQGPGANGYTNQTDPNLGTSFAAPIVSGIAALMLSVNANLTPALLAARLQASATPFPQPAGTPVCPAQDSTTGECACPTGGGQCGSGMVNALRAVTAALKPIGVIVIPRPLRPGAIFDASGSVAACNAPASTPSPLSIAAYHWSATPAAIIEGGADSAKVTVNPGDGGTLTLTLTDSAGHVDVETVTLTATTATSTAAPAAGGSAGACPTGLHVAPVPPTVFAAFAPAAIATNTVSTLMLNLNNSNGFALTQSSLKVTLPDNLTIAASAPVTTTCTGAALTITHTTNSASLGDANIPADGACSIRVSVLSAAPGSYTSTLPADALLTAPAGGNAAPVSATLTVTPPGTGGGGALGWPELLVAAGVLVAARRRATRPGQTMRHASSKDRRGLRGNRYSFVPVPSAQRKLDFTVVPAKNAASTFALKNPDIGPQSSPSARAANIR